MLQVQIRIAEPTDNAAIAGLSAELGYGPEADRAIERLAAMRMPADCAVFVAVDAEGELIGWIHVFVAQRVHVDAAAEIGGLVVAERSRGTGVGRALVAAAEGWAGDKSLGRIRVRSRLSRESAHNFYLRQGYTETKRQVIFDKPLTD